MSTESSFLEAGKIVGVHGVRGAVRVEPWGDGPDVLLSVPGVYLDDRFVRVVRSFSQKRTAVLELEGVLNRESAEALRGKILMVRREDLSLPEGSVFVEDLVGLRAVDAATGEEFGVIRRVDDYPAGKMYVIAVPGAPGGEKLIPDAPVFVAEVSAEGGYVKFHLMEGL